MPSYMNPESYAYYLFFSGLQLLTQIIIADITTLRWRGLVSSLISLPFIVNAFVGANVANQVIQHVGWRWGCKCTLTFIDTE
jgi:MFS family permease